jgi:hypothetical protein
MGNSGSKNGGTVPYKAIFCGDIPLHRPYIGLIYSRYLQFRYLKWPLKLGENHGIIMFKKHHHWVCNGDMNPLVNSGAKWNVTMTS